MSKLACIKHLKTLIKEGDLTSTEALEILSVTNTHDDPEDMPDANNQYYGRLPIKGYFPKLPFDPDYEDEEETPPGRSILTYKGIFYNFNSTTLYPEGREAFMSQLGIKVM